MFRLSKTVWLLSALLLLACAAPLSMQVAKHWIESDTKDRVYSDTEGMPNRRTGLVLGCSPTLLDGRNNFYFLYRMRAAHRLYAAGKIEYIIVSGDNHRTTYDEPSAMKKALIGLGVPAERIVCDYAGFSTLDSVVRAREVFGQNRITVVSQRFHTQRALFIARRKGIDAVGYCAKDLANRHGHATRAREQLARVKTILDLYLLNRQPRFLGEPVEVGHGVPEAGTFPTDKA